MLQFANVTSEGVLSHRLCYKPGSYCRFGIFGLSLSLRSSKAIVVVVVIVLDGKSI